MGRALGVVNTDRDIIYCEGAEAYLRVDKYGKVLISDIDIEKIANLVIEKLKEDK